MFFNCPCQTIWAKKQSTVLVSTLWLSPLIFTVRFVWCTSAAFYSGLNNESGSMSTIQSQPYRSRAGSTLYVSTFWRSPFICILCFVSYKLATLYNKLRRFKRYDKHVFITVVSWYNTQPWSANSPLGLSYHVFISVCSVKCRTSPSNEIESSRIKCFGFISDCFVTPQNLVYGWRLQDCLHVVGLCSFVGTFSCDSPWEYEWYSGILLATPFQQFGFDPRFIVSVPFFSTNIVPQFFSFFVCLRFDIRVSL